MSLIRSPRWSAVALIALTFVLVACLDGSEQSSAPTTPEAEPTSAPGTQPAVATAGTISVTDDGCSFRPAETPPREGLLVFTVVNETDGQAGAHVWGPFTEGHTFDEFSAHLDEEIRLSLAGEEFVGPSPWFGSLIPADPDASLVESGQSGEIRGTARPGSFGIACARTFDDLGLRIHAYAGPLEVEDAD